jgi:hypothetical protein
MCALRVLKSDGGSDYRARVVSEFERLRDLPAGTEFNLWFEYELFCHVNMWFCVWLLRDTGAEIFRVAPDILPGNDIWDGFGRMDAEQLRQCFSSRVKFADDDITLGSQLWTAYQDRDHLRLRELSRTDSRCFPYLSEACEAEIEKNFRPRLVLDELRREGLEGFDEVFEAFRERAGVYGYGDTQVRRILADG